MTFSQAMQTVKYDAYLSRPLHRRLLLRSRRSRAVMRYLLILLLLPLSQLAHAGTWGTPPVQSFHSPSGLNVSAGEPYISATSATGNGGAFYTGTEPALVDGLDIPFTFTGDATATAIATGVSELPDFKIPLIIAGLTLAGLQYINGQYVKPQPGAYPGNPTCSDGSAELGSWSSAPAASFSTFLGAMSASNWVFKSASQINAGIQTFFSGNGYSNYEATWSPIPCPSGTQYPPLGPTPSMPATPGDIAGAIGVGLTNNPGLAPNIANSAASAGAVIPTTSSSTSGPSSVTGAPTKTTTTNSSGVTSTTTSTPTFNFSYSPNSISITQVTNTSTQTSGPAGSASSASSSTTTSPPSTGTSGPSGQPLGPSSSPASSGSGAGFTAPGAPSYPASSSPTGVITLPAVNIAAASGSCPAPVTFSAFGQTFTIPLDPFCQLASEVAPFFIAMNGLAAALFILR